MYADVIRKGTPSKEDGKQGNQEFFLFKDYPAQQENHIYQQNIWISKAKKGGEPDLFRTEMGWQKGKDKENSKYHIGTQYELSENPLQNR